MTAPGAMPRCGPGCSGRSANDVPGVPWQKRSFCYGLPDAVRPETAPIDTCYVLIGDREIGDEKTAHLAVFFSAIYSPTPAYAGVTKVHGLTKNAAQGDIFY